MPYLNICGFESGNLWETGTTISQGNYSIVGSAAKNGNYGLRCWNTGDSGQDYKRLRSFNAAGQPDGNFNYNPLYINFWFYPQVAAGTEGMFACVGTTNQFRVYYSPDERLQTHDSGGSHWDSTGIGSVPFQEWSFVQFQIGTGNPTVAKVWINGVLKIDRSDYIMPETKDKCNFGKPFNNASAACEYWYDDIAIASFQPPDGAVYLMPADGDGLLTQFTRSGGATNWETLDEIPVNTGDYVDGTAQTQKNYITVDDSLLPAAGTVHAVMACTHNFRYAGGGVGALKNIIRSGASEHKGAGAWTSGSTSFHKYFTTTDPATAAAWQISALASLQAGVEEDNPGPAFSRVYNAMIMVFMDEITVDAPTNLVATAVSSTQIDLEWDDNSDDENGFAVERSTNGVDFDLIGSVGASVTTYDDTDLVPNTMYWYRVRAFKFV